MHPSRVTKAGSRHTNQGVWDRNHSDGRHGLSVDARALRILAAVLSHAWGGSHTLPRCPGISGCSCRSACLGVIFGCRGWCADWGATLGLGFAWSIVVHEPWVRRTRSGCASCAVARTLDPTFSSRVVMGCSSSTPSAISSYHRPFVPRFTVHLHLQRHRRSPFPTLHALSGWGVGSRSRGWTTGRIPFGVKFTTNGIACGSSAAIDAFGSRWRVVTTREPPSSVRKDGCTRWNTPWKRSDTQAHASVCWPRTGSCWLPRRKSPPKYVLANPVERRRRGGREERTKRDEQRSASIEWDRDGSEARGRSGPGGARTWQPCLEGRRRKDRARGGRGADRRSFGTTPSRKRSCSTPPPGKRCIGSTITSPAPWLESPRMPTY